MKAYSIIICLIIISRSFSYAQATKAQPQFRDPISIDDACHLVEKMLKQSTLQKIAKTKTFGGFFPADVFKIRPGNIGVLLWYCYNPESGDNGFPELFFAVEQVQIYDDSLHTLPVPGDSIVIPERFTYSQTTNDFNKIKGFVIGHVTKTSLRSQPISAANVRKFSKNFLSLISIISGDTTLCKYPFALFKNNSSYDHFMKKAGLSYVRYYLGMSLDAKHKPNYLRPILAGADASGGTILNLTKSRAEDPFLQKSVPPPPSN